MSRSRASVETGSLTSRALYRRAFLLLSLLLVLAALAARALSALGTGEILDWDETYYASTTSTAAHGLGFYPYVLGYPAIPNMGGVGYVVSLYVLAYRLLGPHLLALRLVSLLASLVAVAGLSVLTGRLYGSAAGLAALAITPSLLVFHLSNTIRLDVFAIAFVAWALVLYAHAAGKQDSIGWHILVGLTFALGLEVHLHTAAAAFAVGFAYLVHTIALRRDATRSRLVTKPLVGFVAGYAVGALLFVAVHVLPNPQGFFRTAALARLSAAGSSTQLNLTAPMDSSRLAQTFFSPALIVPKEIARYRSMFHEMSGWEALLWLFGLPTFMLLRQTPHAFRGRALLVGAVLGGGIVFNSPSPLYFSAILPFFVPALASFVTHGFGKKARLRTVDVAGSSVAILLLLAIAILPRVLSRTVPAITRLGQPDTVKTPPAIVSLVRSSASSECIVAGPTDLYAEYFMAYPRFVGTRWVEVLIGSTYYDMQHHVVTYWYEKRPDIVFGKPDAELGAYLAEAKYTPIAEGVWKKPDNWSAGCVINVRADRP
jgi:4-amino-4-deoxy-L-arabinose transferase-like glycosyltransferase